MGESVRIVEVGPRDGLQNESQFVPTNLKADFISKLAASGLREIEVTSFVSPKWIPQLADAEELSAQLSLSPSYSALVPNRKGLERAVACGYKRIALFTAASETFCRKNINMSRDDSVNLFRDLIVEYRSQGGPFVRGYISTAFECPYEGPIDAKTVLELVQELFEIGVDEVSLGDTIGVAGPAEVKRLAAMAGERFDRDAIAFHFHDTRGTAISNVAAALNEGFTIFDSSAAGLGGCPYAPGAGGNLATEDLVYFLKREGLTVDVDLEALANASLAVLEALGRGPNAKSQLAVLAGRQDSCAIPPPGSQ